MLAALVRPVRRYLLARMFAGLMLSVIVATSAYALYAYASEHRAREAALRNRIELLASTMAETLAVPMFDFNTVAVASAVRAVRQDADIIQLRVSDTDGKTLAEWEKPGQKLEGLIVHRQAITYSNGRKQNVPVGTLQILYSNASVEAALRDSLRNILISDGLLALFIIITSFAILTQVTMPLNDIVRALGKLAEDDTDVQLSGLNRLDEIGRMSKAVRSFQNAIERRREAEHKVQGLLDEKNAVLDNALVGILTTHRDIITSCNRRVEEIFGYQPGELIGQKVRILALSDIAYEHSRHRIKEAFARGEAYSGELQLRRKNGEVFWGALTGRRPPGEAVADHSYTWIYADISERVHAQRELDNYRQHLEELVATRTAELALAKDQAEAASRAKGEFLANMSHEIRSPMNAVLGMAHLALRSELTTQQRDYIEKIRISGEHLLGIINDVLDMSKIEAGKLQLDNVDFELAAVFANVETLVSDRIVAKGLRYSASIDPALNVPLTGDALRLSQILLNFVSNAIKFTDVGEVSLRASLVEAYAQSFIVRLEVQDTGIGISAEGRAKLFEQFAQADASTTRKYGGTGLGLAISRRLAELMDGRIGVDSEVGRGSTFWVHVRLQRASGAQRQLASLSPQRIASASLAGVRVLLADDNNFNQQVGREMLEDVGVHVELASSGTEVLEALAREKFDLVFMDLQMPGMDGLTATRKIREIPALKDLPVIAMTANAFAEDRQRCLDVGMNDFLTKPVQADRLYAVIEQFVSLPAAAGPVSAIAPEPGPAPEAEAVIENTGSIISLVALAEIGRNKPEKMRHFARRFIESAEQGMSELLEAESQRDLIRLTEVAHRVKASARWVGATRLGMVFESIEAMGKRGDATGAGALLEEAREIVALARQEVETLCVENA